MAASKEKISTGEYVIGFCSFVPVIGVLLGLVSIVLGALRFKAGGWKLIALGLGGIFFTTAIYAGFYFTVFNSDKKNKGYALISKQYLKQTMMAVEYYKLVHGQYPEHLEDMSDKKDPFSRMNCIYDISGGMSSTLKMKPFFYELTPDKQHYYLLGVGPDEQPFTADDINPELDTDELAHVGYVKK
ncbi:MAG TPA: hypothetical protein VK791_02200 [bacterium]|jgi:hypothetical protein|nr:hypothetical protein [bacterium]